MKAGKIDRSARNVVAVIVIAILAMGTTVTGADASRPFLTDAEFNTPNSSILNETIHTSFHETPEPVTVFRIEVTETALPGPRYMAFGPSVIGISIDPVILSTLIVLGVIGIGAWCIRNYGR
jgi:hypothetical protein